MRVHACSPGLLRVLRTSAFVTRWRVSLTLPRWRRCTLPSFLFPGLQSADVVQACLGDFLTSFQLQRIVHAARSMRLLHTHALLPAGPQLDGTCSATQAAPPVSRVKHRKALYYPPYTIYTMIPSAVYTPLIATSARACPRAIPQGRRIPSARGESTSTLSAYCPAGPCFPSRRTRCTS